MIDLRREGSWPWAEMGVVEALIESKDHEP
jgi:hypothetical protein